MQHMTVNVDRIFANKTEITEDTLTVYNSLIGNTEVRTFIMASQGHRLFSRSFQVLKIKLTDIKEENR